MGQNKQQGRVFNFGDVLTDVQPKGKTGGYNITIIDNKGGRPDLGRIDVGSRDMLTEVLSWFVKN